MQPADTPSAQRRSNPGDPGILDDAIHLARGRLLSGRRVDAGELAKALGVNRSTLYRWFGGKDGLLNEVLWSLARDTWALAMKRTGGSGVERALGVLRRFVTALAESDGYRAFLRREPDAAARVLFTGRDSLRMRIVPLFEHLLREEGVVPDGAEPSALAFALVRVGEAFMYADNVAESHPDVESIMLTYGLILER